MDVENKNRITQNVVYIKTTLSSHLDPIIDRLIEGGIFGLADRSRIEAVSAPHKQFNAFIDILVASPDTNAYRVFRKALRSEGYAVIADRLDQTTPRISVPRSASSRDSPRRDNSVNTEGPGPEAVGASGRISSSNRCNDCKTGESTVQNALDSFNRNQQVFLEEIQRRRDEDLVKMEEQRRRDKDEWQHQFEKWKKTILKEQDVTCTGITQRYLDIQEKYDHLKEIQKGMRLKDSERHEKLKILNKDHVILTTKYQELQQAYADLEKEMNHIKYLLSNAASKSNAEDGGHPGENANIVDQLTADKQDLLLQLEEKLAEIANLQEQLDLQNDVIDRKKSEEENVQSTIQAEREQKFDKLYEMVETMAKERTLVVDDPRKPEQRPKANLVLHTSRMQLTERQWGRTKMQGSKPSKVQLGMDDCN